MLLFTKKVDFRRENADYLLIKQGVALTGRNTTGPPSRAAPGELRCICAAMECYRRRQMPESITSLTLLYCV